MPHAKRPSSSSAAKGKTYGKAPDQQNQMAWGGFINIKLSATQKTAFDAYVKDANAAAWDAVSSLLFDGSKLTLTYNPINDTVNASVTGQLVHGVDQRFTLSCFAPDWQQAILLLVFKWDVVAQRELAPFAVGSGGSEERYG